MSINSHHLIFARVAVAEAGDIAGAAGVAVVDHNPIAALDIVVV